MLRYGTSAEQYRVVAAVSAWMFEHLSTGQPTLDQLSGPHTLPLVPLTARQSQTVWLPVPGDWGWQWLTLDTIWLTHCQRRQNISISGWFPLYTLFWVVASLIFFLAIRNLGWQSVVCLSVCGPQLQNTIQLYIKYQLTTRHKSVG